MGNCYPNCDLELSSLEDPPAIVPDDLQELDWFCIKNISLVPKILAKYLRCGFLAVESSTPVKATGAHATPWFCD
jgi:hypothetical protein